VVSPLQGKKKEISRFSEEFTAEKPYYLQTNFTPWKTWFST